MKARDVRILNAYQRVQRYLDDNASTLGTVSTSAPRQALDTVVTALGVNAAQQQSSQVIRKGTTNQIGTLRRALRRQMSPVAAIVADKLSAIPEIPPFAMPPFGLNAGLLVSAANAMAVAATAYEQTFIADGLASDFIAQLQAAAKALNDAVTQQGTVAGHAIKATSAITTQRRQGRRSLNILHAMVMGTIHDDPDATAEWQSVRLVGSAASGGSTPAAAPASPTPATPAPATTAAPAPAASPASPTTQVKA